jgi:hypothetical protein
MRFSRAVAVLPLLLVLAACDFPMAPTAEDYAPSILPGQVFKIPSDHLLEISGDYRLPQGTYRIDYNCSGAADYRIDDQSGSRTGRCDSRTGVNTGTVSNVVGPGTLGVALVTDAIGTGTFTVHLR